ncbi:010L [Cherax quadricarinatus iridovirus]|uniref:Uncharacterized protein n=1 Tax=Shrimp hemocyte iridescent virus TaxID=2039780 RepID=A0A291B0X6_9VIRU|nr:010L [Cherax quadricarinatus iridovirus]YP_010084892.1 hypothetical protein KM509_gp140 [Shrimp hemocyte iridescent virus]UPA43330.1 hypothetical protein 4TH000056 [Iridovirus CN01]ASZ84990.1 010L [Cherax quadricarinatus iridovirus]ATE87149.1 hypothetical protein [Shrimp hemocyte iridescent virus]UPA43565.1 hypothetical protein 3TG000132 [Iridovirus CN01]UPA43600.1 hypothetical protein 1DG000008 [Iridovirus CN01]
MNVDVDTEELLCDYDITPEMNTMKVCIMNCSDLFIPEINELDESDIDFTIIILFTYIFDIENFHISKDCEFVCFENLDCKKIKYDFPEFYTYGTHMFFLYYSIKSLYYMFDKKLITLKELEKLVEKSFNFIFWNYMTTFPHLDINVEWKYFTELKRSTLKNSKNIEKIEDSE